jgi:FkbM family methyltransferase
MEDYEMVDYQSSDPRTKVDGHTQDYWLSKFFQSGGDINLYNLNLNNTSVVFDMGTYNGEYYQTLYNKFQPIIHTFEPIEEFTKNLPKVPNLVVNAFALGKQNETFELSLNENSSSAFTSGNKVTCIKHKFIDYVTSNNIDSIDLIKINIEGGEYELLNAIIESNWIDKIDMYLVQFHYLSHDPVSQRQKIIDKLKQTHEPIFYYPFVWELWKRKDVI